MKIALVDDEKVYLDEMAQICRKFGVENRLEIEASLFPDGESFLGSLDNNGYSVVFMDIYMSGINGVSAAKKLRERDPICVLIFLTTSGDYMPEAFSCHAFEYIKKPFTEQRIAEVMKDALEIIPNITKYIELCCDRMTVKVMFDDIVSVVSDAHYLNVKTICGNTLRCRMTMTDFMERTNDPRFILVNRGVAVNADHIIDFENSCCVTDIGVQLPIRVRDRLKIEQAVRNYNFDKIRSCQRCGK